MCAAVPHANAMTGPSEIGELENLEPSVEINRAQLSAGLYGTEEAVGACNDKSTAHFPGVALASPGPGHEAGGLARESEPREGGVGSQLAWMQTSTREFRESAREAGGVPVRSLQLASKGDIHGRLSGVEWGMT